MICKLRVCLIYVFKSDLLIENIRKIKLLFVKTHIINAHHIQILEYNN